MTTELPEPDFDRLFGSGQTFDLRTELKWLTKTNNWLSNNLRSLQNSGAKVSGPLVESESFEKTLKSTLPSLLPRLRSIYRRVRHAEEKESLALTEHQVKKYRTITESLYDVQGLRVRIKEWAESRLPTTGTVLERGGEPAVSWKTPSGHRHSGEFS